MSGAIPRRVFLHQSSAMTLLAGMGSWACVPGPQRAAGSRITLPEPGPMLPPVPAIFLTVNGRGEDPDEISVVWTFVVNGDPPQVGISAATEHVARDLVDLHETFVLNVPTSNIVQAFDTVDMNSSRVADKFALSGLTRGQATRVDAPTVEECPIHVECSVFDTIAVPPVRTIFLAHVVATTADERVVDEDGRLRVRAARFFGMTAGSGEFYTLDRNVGHIGMTVGRDDIKY